MIELSTLSSRENNMAVLFPSCSFSLFSCFMHVDMIWNAGVNVEAVVIDLLQN